MRKLATVVLGVAALSSAACSDILNVPNPNNPDVKRAYATPATIRNIIGTLFQQVHAGIHGSTGSLGPQLQASAFETYGTVANFGMNVREALPRGAVLNNRNNITYAENWRDFSTMSQRTRDAANVVQALDALRKGGGTLGDPAKDSATNNAIDLANRAFAIFSGAVALGNLALAYDSAAIVTHTSAPATDKTPPLSGHAAVMTAALAELDSALAIGSSPAAAKGFPLADTYMAGNSVTQDFFERVVHSYKARFRADVARTPAERAAVDWDAVITDVNAGISSDLVLQMSSGAGWNVGWEGSQMFQSDAAGWHQMPMMIYGMADTSGAYSAWLGQPLGSRTYFLVQTPDKRWPSGSTRAQQQDNSPTTWAYDKFPYIRNRSGQDTPGEPWGNSYYDFFRFHGLFENNQEGPWVEMSKTEMDMLAAEGYIRKGDFASAVNLINKSRTRAGIPAIGTITSATQPVGTPGTASCVPMVPAAPDFSSATCGDIMEAMKYEKRMETAFTGYSLWFFDNRGWGDLPEGTPLEWPVPYQEMDARTEAFYNLGGLGGKSSAAKSQDYGW